MKALFSEIRGAIVSTLVIGVVVCGLYPAAVWAIGRVAFRDKADGSLVRDKDGAVRGSALLGQPFTGTQYFHPRPSAAGTNGYDAAGSGGSNLGPTSQKLSDQIKDRVAAYRMINGLSPETPVPADAVTASASGLDPHISLQNAQLQTGRVAKARNLPEDKVRALISANTDGSDLGILGDAGVNVLKLNLALNALEDSPKAKAD